MHACMAGGPWTCLWRSIDWALDLPGDHLDPEGVGDEGETVREIVGVWGFRNSSFK